MTTLEFPTLVQRFFADHLSAQRNLSSETRTGYRTTFRLLLRYLSQHHRCPVDRLTLAAVTPEAILAFLDHLERSRGNCAATRNLRLAAIRTFTRFVLGQSASVDFLATGQRILAIPQKKTPKRMLGFMSREEVEAVFAAIDRSFSAYPSVVQTPAVSSVTLRLDVSVCRWFCTYAVHDVRLVLPVANPLRSTPSACRIGTDTG